ncbi:MAG TPA: transporter substrate-binding domain-containing protein [Clostridia bacterium]|nr:transporter substrate-binding domain-containing protein [Clostridia bacterium]
MKKFLAILAVLAMTVGITGCSGGASQSQAKPSAGTAATSGFGADKLEKIKSSGTLVVGCDPTIQNICYLDSSTNSQTGFIPDIVEGFAKQLGVKVKWETLEWSAMISALNRVTIFALGNFARIVSS